MPRTAIEAMDENDVDLGFWMGIDGGDLVWADEVEAGNG